MRLYRYSRIAVMGLAVLLLTVVNGSTANNDLTLTPQLQQPPHAVVQRQQPGSGPSMTAPPELHDIYPPVEISTPPPAWVWFAAAAAVIAIAAIIIWLFRRRHRQTPEVAPSPEDLALADITRARQLYNNEEYAPYAKELSDILRRYLESRFQLFSTRRTSSELLGVLTTQNNPLFTQNKGLITDLLQQADMAKFARHTPAPASLLAFESGLIELINNSHVPLMEEEK